MNTKEIAYKIIEHLTEKQLKEFISLFWIIYSKEDDEQKKRNNAFVQLQSLIKSVPNFDEKKT